MAQFYTVGKFAAGDIKRKNKNILLYALKMDSTDGKTTRKVIESVTNIKLDEAIFI